MFEIRIIFSARFITAFLKNFVRASYVKSTSYQILWQVMHTSTLKLDSSVQN